MSRYLILSPHADDAIFSLGAFMQRTSGGEVKIYSPFAGIPDDAAGKRKHTLIRKEHSDACSYLEDSRSPIIIDNGDYLDDVYQGDRDISTLSQQLVNKIVAAESILIPFGIHHPDHELLSNFTISLLNTMNLSNKFIYFYEELPYRVLYSGLSGKRFEYIERMTKKKLVDPMIVRNNEIKEIAVGMYESQVQSPTLLDELKHDEHIWRLK